MDRMKKTYETPEMEVFTLLLEEIPGEIDKMEREMAVSAELNFQMWNPADDRSMNNGNIINGDENMSFHDAIQRLKSNFNTHLAIIESKL